MNVVNNKLLQDLEIHNKVIPKIDFTITTFGKNKFRELFNVVLYDQKTLLRRKQIINSIIQNPTKKNKIIKYLKQIKECESSIQWLFGKVEKEHKDLYFTKEFFNTQDLLSTKNFLKIYTPSIIVLIYLVIYVVLNYNGIQIDLIDYIQKMYEGYKALILGMLFLFMENINMISFLTNLLATLYLLYQIYTIYNSCDSSLTHYYKCSNFTNHINNVITFIDCTKEIYKLDKFLIFEKKLMCDDITKFDNLFDSKVDKFGYKLIIKKNNKEYKNIFNKITQYIGSIDAFINIANLTVNHNYAFPTFDFNKKNPYINAKNIWCPYMNKFTQIKNDGYYGNENPNTIILTGANTSGKSTYIRNIMLSIFLAQTIGVTCSDNLTFTPFNHFFTYLDIPNVSSNRESLFEAEVMRCMEYCNILEKLKDNEYVFTIMDELLTATNPQESMATSFAFCEYIGNFKNGINIITTHFTELCELETLHRGKIKNMKFDIIKNLDGTFYRPYKITDGISNQCVAIELLKLKGYNNSIIDRAIEKVKKNL